MLRAAVLFLLLQTTSVLSEVTCTNYVDITDGVRSGTDIIKDGVTYTKNDYFTVGYTIKGCICNVRQCVRKCCLEGEVMDLNKKSCVPSDETPITNFSVYSIITVPENRICKEVQTKVIIDEDFTIVDGVLIWEDINFALEDFCLTFQGTQWIAIACIKIEQSVEGLLTSLGGKEKLTYNEWIYGGDNSRSWWFHVQDRNKKSTDDESFITYKTYLNGMIISMPFLLITFVVYLLLPERNLHRRALMSYVFTLLAAYITLVTIQLYSGQFPDVACHVLGHLIIFFFLVSFFWMNVMCIDMWLAFSGMRAFMSKPNAERKRFAIYCVYAWGLPILHTLLVFLINTYGDPNSGYHPEIGKRRCFLGEELPTFYYFYLPMALLIGINIVLFILTTVRIQRIKRETSMLKHSDSKRHSYEDDKQKFNLYLKLMFAMGVNWIMELVSWAVEWKIKETPTFVWYLTDFTNAMYGVLIFMIFVFKKKIWKSLQKRYYVFIGKPHLAHTVTQSSARGTRTSNYSTTETNLNSEYRLNDIVRNTKPEETALRA